MTVSPFIIKALVDVITGGVGQGADMAEPVGIYRSGPKIEQFFLDCGVDMRIGPLSRVPATTEALRQAANGWEGHAVIERVLLRAADPRDYLGDPTKGDAVLSYLNRSLEPENFALVIVGGKPRLVRRDAAGHVVTAFIDKVAILDFDTVQLEIARAVVNAGNDPEDAVTAACSLLEAVCRSILMELRLPLPPKRDIDGLIRAVQDPLGLSPGRTDLPSEVEADIRQVLGGLTSVSKGIGALRTHAGDAHGRERGRARIDARIARLAIHSASSIALFLIETWEHQHRRALPLREETP